MPRRCLPALALILALAVTAPAAAFRLPDDLGPVAGNPADRLLGWGIDDPVYDPARRCDRDPKAGVRAFAGWLDRNAAGAFWGSYRCERWGDGQASLHAENRAIDWGLDSDRPATRAAGKRLIHLLLAPDREGNPQALARRMGVQEIIWDCSYWGAGMPQFRPYSPCFDREGERRRRVGRTLAHVDHLHIGMSRAGAAGRTSFWRATR